MTRVVKAPPLRFTCTSCGAVCEGDENDFRPLPTNPPQWEVDCGYCRIVNKVSPQPLVAKLVGSM